MEKDRIVEKYKEFIQSISLISNYVIVSNKVYNEIFIRVQDRLGNDEFAIKLFQDLCSEDSDKRNYVTIYWRVNPYYFDNTHYIRFHDSVNQSMMFNIILFKIIDQKLEIASNNIFKVIDKAFKSTAIVEWLKTKEEQIRTEERAKAEIHLSTDELRKIFIEELGRVNINLKIEDK